MSDTATEDDVEAARAAEHPMARTGRRLGWLGVVPFVVLAAWLYAIALDHPWRPGTIVLLVMYGALFLSFLGGARWGLASVARTAKPAELALSVLPMLAGWASFALDPPYTFAALAVVFAAVGAWDAMASHAAIAPSWYGRLRVRQTGVIVAAMVLAFAATAQGS